MYYQAVKIDGFWIGQLYKYDDSGNNEIIVWESDLKWCTKEEAINDVVEYMEYNDIDAEMG